MVQRKGCRDYGSTVYPGCVRRAYEVREGKLEVLSYEMVAPERIRDLYEYMAQKLVNNGIVKQPDCEEAVFYQTYFEPVWKMALER